jgi:hypothetical protein
MTGVVLHGMEPIVTYVKLLLAVDRDPESWDLAAVGVV